MSTKKDVKKVKRSAMVKGWEQDLAKFGSDLNELDAKMQEDYKTDDGVKSEDREKFDKMFKDATDLRERIEKHLGIGDITKIVEPNSDSKNFAVNGSKEIVRTKSLGRIFTESDEYKDALGDGNIGQGLRCGVETKATFDTDATGLDSTVNYLPGIIEIEQQRLTIRNLLATGETSMNAVPYVTENSFNNAADVVAEGAEKPEATFDTAPASAPVKKIAVRAKVTEEMWADFPSLRSYIDGRMRFMVGSKEEQQLLNGSGVGAEILGIRNVAGIQSQAKGADTIPDAVFKAITKVRTIGFFEPDGFVVHPNDWQRLKLLKDDNNQYYGGGPFTGAYGNQMMNVERFWGLPTVITTAITEGTALVGAFRLGGQIFDRMGIRMDSTNSNEDDFNKNLISMRVEERLALAVYRALAFCEVTGINA